MGLAGRPRRDEILHAIGEHDNGWQETDAAPAVDPSTGKIVDFVTAPVSVRQAVWPRAVARLVDHPWAATLVAQHAITIYDRFRPDVEWTAFFGQMEAMRDSLLRSMNMSLDDLLADYDFVRLGDLISLTFCTGWTDEQGYGQWTVNRSGARVVVTPDVLGGSVIPIAIEAREIRSQGFRSDAALHRVLKDAPIMALRGEVAGHS